MVHKTSNKVEVGKAFDLLGKSLEIVKNNWQIFAIVNIFGILYAIINALNPGDYSTNKINNPIFSGPAEISGVQVGTIIGGGLLIFLIFAVINFFFIVMNISLQLKSAGGKKPEFSELFDDGKKYFFPMLGLIILLAIIISVGFILLIVPGVIAIGRLAMAPFIMIDKKVGIEEALKQSNKLGKKYFGKVWEVILIIILISVLTGIISGIPLLGPLAGTAIGIAYSVILALRYKQLQGHKI